MPNNISKYNWNAIQKEYDSGLSYRDLRKKYGMSLSTITNAKQNGLFLARTRIEGNILAKKTKPQKHGLETRNKLSEIRISALNENAFYSKRTNYNGIKLDSSYELSVAKQLDLFHIKWIRPSYLKYIDDCGQTRRYLPDFYLIDFDVYLDPKNDYLITKDLRKIELVKQFNNVKIIILDKNNLLWEKILQQITA
jgi:hypothetical protein